ncbi:hypothetical protein FF904_07950 [Bordetella pertussis]|nr:hypothetical protein FF904_07950 [Bordetella pertussis]
MSTSAADTLSRPSGRAVDALRPFSLERGFTRYAEGSVLGAGNTHAVHGQRAREGAAVSEGTRRRLGDRRVRHAAARHAYARRPRGRARQAKRPHPGIQRLIGRSLRAVFDLRLLGERTLHLDCDVLQADGGTRCASITGAWWPPPTPWRC